MDCHNRGVVVEEDEVWGLAIFLTQVGFWKLIPSQP
jgi:hypothetical protein